MSLEQENIVNELDSDIIGSQFAEAVSRLNPGLARLDKTTASLYPALCYLAFAVYGGKLQIDAEARKIIIGTAGDKFPLGWESFNPTEEFLEGSIPVVIGAFAGKKAYGLMCSILFKEGGYNKFGELTFMMIGALWGYSAMVKLGAVLEQQLGIPDIKWGPFK